MRTTAEGVIEHHQSAFIDRVCDDLQHLIDKGTITEAEANQAIGRTGDDALVTGWDEWKEDSE